MRISRASVESAPRRYQGPVVTVMVLLFIAAFVGWVSGRNFGAGASLTLFIFFTGILLFIPETAPTIVLLGTYDFLGFVDPTTFGRIPGIFKFRDLLLIATVLAALAQVLMARRERDLLRFSCVRAALGFSLYAAAVIPYTVLMHHSSLNLACRVSEPYFYYLLMIPVIIFTRNARKLYTLLVVLLVLALVPEVVSVLQIVTHKAISPFVDVLWMDVGGLSLPRSYVLSFNLTGLALFCLFGIYLYVPSARIRLLCAVSAVAVSAGVVLTFGRAFWMGTIGALLFLFAVAHVGLENRSMVLKRTIALWGRIAAISILAVILLLLSGRERSILGFTGVIGRRFVSTFSDISERRGTFGYRLRESAFRLEALQAVSISRSRIRA